MGNTGMYMAVVIGNLQMVKMLDDYGADATIKNNDDLCPIEVAEAEELKELVTHFMS